MLGVHGVLPEERELPQPFEIDMDLYLDLAPAGRSDDLVDTADYARAAEVAAGVVAGEHCALLETLAERIAEAVLADHRVGSVTLWVRKLEPPVPLEIGSTGVRISRSRVGKRL